VGFARIYYDERREGSMPLLLERLLLKMYNYLIIKENYDERREGSMPLLLERLLLKMYNYLIIKEKLVPGRGILPRL
jgi:hypothetical protein